jgi:heterodisulfide reductase subunit A-like polyferredoxin
VVIATGLDPVPAALVPEYGHGLRRGVLTAPELEERIAAGRPLVPGDLRSAVFIQCVGSRTERRGVPYCSALCCANAIKNALAVKREDPSREVTVLYIDIRTAGPGQEALYREARKAGVRFIRGQPSLVTEKDGRLLVCGENTLLRELYELPADLVVLATGLRQSPSNLLMFDELEVAQGTAGFPTVFGSRSSSKGLFIAGSAKGPMDLPTAERDARACALDVHEYLRSTR